MGKKLTIVPINRGLRTDRTAFNIDDDSFPNLTNAYQWRGRVRRKRGTSTLGRLNLQVSASGTLSSGVGVLINAPIVPGSMSITTSVDGQTYTDTTMNGILTGNASGIGTINYATGSIYIASGGSSTLTGTYYYYPSLPVMGLEDLQLPSVQFPGTIAFDTTYAYNISTNNPYTITNVSFYKNPSTNTYDDYVAKSSSTPLNWNGQNYQQFWTTNYEGAFWETNGVQVPFNFSNIGMQFAQAVDIAYTSNTATTITITITSIPVCPLVVGDFVFFNEWTGTYASTLNFQTGYVITSSVAGGVNTLVIKLPNADLGTATYTPGIVQYLTNNSDSSVDCIRWYDGNSTGQGWVNFMPPLIFTTDNNISIADLPNLVYYLVGAKLVLQFKDRLHFFGAVVQTSTTDPVYLQDTVVWSSNGTPYYTASFVNDPTLATTVFNPILTPLNQGANPAGYVVDVTGFGGFLTAGTQQAITYAAPNEDALIVGFYNSLQTRYVFTGNNFQPFNFFIINAELGTGSTFSVVTTDDGVITRGPRGFIITSQTSCNRIDLDILDQVFEIQNINNGTERFCAQRDFINEWIYFTYPSNSRLNYFPNQTLQFNYRDNTWAIFNESYTTYGSFRRNSGLTWATVGQTYPTWADWDVPWNAGSSTLLQPEVIAGTTQGYIMFRDEGTGEGDSIYIENISFPVGILSIPNSGSGGPTVILTNGGNFAIGQTITISGVLGMTQINGGPYTITNISGAAITIAVDSSEYGTYISGGVVTPTDQIYSPNHCLNDGDYIIISGCLGTIGWQVNNKVFSVTSVTSTGFTLNPGIVPVNDIYLGLGQIQRLYVPQIQTKQFPMAWDMGRKTRIGPQAYLFERTDVGQITVQIFLSQDQADAWNDPINNPAPNSLEYSQVVYTCPESTNLGLTPFNVNLQTPTSNTQQQIWHRMNTSLIGDTVQLGITLNDAQMRSYVSGAITTITNIVNSASASPTVITCNNSGGLFGVGQLVLINGVQGMTQLNGNIYIITASDTMSITIGVDSSSFGNYTMGGMATIQSPEIQTEEIELHSIILDVSPSSLLI